MTASYPQCISVPHITGLLDAVSDVIVEYNSPSFIISWTAPFTYQVPFVNPLISYCISITNTSSGSILVNQTCELLNTNYSVELEYDPCVEYSATIIAVNPVGDGQPKVIPFPGNVALLIFHSTPCLVFCLIHFYSSRCNIVRALYS